MRFASVACTALGLLPSVLVAQSRTFPPDSLVNTRVIPRGTPVIQVIGQMRSITFALGVRCQYCHLGEEGMPLEQFDFASDERRTKRTAREMMRMLQAINGEWLTRVPERSQPTLEVTCETCHRGTARPMPLFTLLVEAATAAGADSAVRAYTALRQEHYGRAAYDFGEPTLNIAAFRLARGNRFDEAFALLRLNEEQFPGASSMYLFRGNILLMRSDTAGAATAFREAMRRNPGDREAAMRLGQIGRQP